jgi:hypothetical protein
MRLQKTSDTTLSPVNSNENRKVLDYKIGIDQRIFTRGALVRKTTFRLRPIKWLLGMINSMMVLTSSLLEYLIFSKDNKQGSFSAHSSMQITSCY